MTARLLLLALAALMLGPTSTTGAQNMQLDLSLCAPDQHGFTLDIDNEYFPLPVGQQWVLAGQEEGQSLGLQITVLDATETFFAGRRDVTTRVVEEREWEDANGDGRIDGDEDLIEVSLNYFARTEEGTVCYFGEHVDFYEGGIVVGHEGSWRADDPGNAPGIFMPAEPEVGMTFQQEVAPEVAEDEATIVRSGTLGVPAGTFDETIELLEFNPLNGGTSSKVYAEDVGIIKDATFALIELNEPDEDEDGDRDDEDQDGDGDEGGDGDGEDDDRDDGLRGDRDGERRHARARRIGSPYNDGLERRLRRIHRAEPRD